MNFNAYVNALFNAIYKIYLWHMNFQIMKQFLVLKTFCL